MLCYFTLYDSVVPFSYKYWVPFTQVNPPHVDIQAISYIVCTDEHICQTHVCMHSTVYIAPYDLWQKSIKKKFLNISDYF